MAEEKAKLENSSADLSVNTQVRRDSGTADSLNYSITQSSRPATLVSMPSMSKKDEPSSFADPGILSQTSDSQFINSVSRS